MVAYTSVLDSYALSDYCLHIKHKKWSDQGKSIVQKSKRCNYKRKGTNVYIYDQLLYNVCILTCLSKHIYS